MEEQLEYRAFDKSDTDAVVALIREYIAWIDEDLSFQGIEQELAAFPGPYAAPTGAFMLACSGNKIAGCMGLKALEPGVCELKRLYVRDTFKGRGIGRELVARMLAHARTLGYTRARLDTLAKMKSAQSLYRSFGFTEISQYVENPIPGTVFMEIEL